MDDITPIWHENSTVLLLRKKNGFTFLLPLRNTSTVTSENATAASVFGRTSVSAGRRVPDAERKSVGVERKSVGAEPDSVGAE